MRLSSSGAIVTLPVTRNRVRTTAQFATNHGVDMDHGLQFVWNCVPSMAGWPRAVAHPRLQQFRTRPTNPTSATRGQNGQPGGRGWLPTRGSQLR